MNVITHVPALCGQGINVCKRGIPIDPDKRASHSEKCLQCHDPVLAIDGRFTGTFYNIGPKNKHPVSSGGKEKGGREG